MDSLAGLWASPVVRKVFFSFVAILFAWGGKRFLARLVDRRARGEHKRRFVIRKLVGYVVDAFLLLFIFIIWAQPILTDLSLTIGIFGAGLAFAFQEIIGSFAGWVTVLTTQPFGIGDRIELGGVKGDVVDIGPLFVKILEIRNWLNYDYPTGRVVSVANSAIFDKPVFNYTYTFPFIWDQIVVPVTYNSNWQLAGKIMREAIEQQPDYQKLRVEAKKALSRARQRFAIEEVTLAPQVFVKLTDNWIELTLLYPVEAVRRPAVHSAVSALILQRFEQAAEIMVASETIDVVHVGQVDGFEGHGQS